MLETQEYRTVLVGIDGSNQAYEAFQKALAVAKRNDAKIIVAHIIENRLYGNMGYSLTNAELIDVETERAKDMLEEYETFAKDQGVDNVKTVLSFGSPKVIMSNDLPKEYDVDLIMVGQTGLNAVERLVMGSVSDYIIRNAPCDVLIVRPETTEK